MIRIYVVDETEYCSGIPEGVTKIEGVYLFNDAEGVHCCELTPSYYMRCVANLCWYDYAKLTQEQLEEVEDYEAELHRYLWESDFYIHCHNVDVEKCLIWDKDQDNPTEEDWDDIEEEYRANPLYC